MGFALVKASKKNKKPTLSGTLQSRDPTQEEPMRFSLSKSANLTDLDICCALYEKGAQCDGVI